MKKKRSNFYGNIHRNHSASRSIRNETYLSTLAIGSPIPIPYFRYHSSTNPRCLVPKRNESYLSPPSHLHPSSSSSTYIVVIKDVVTRNKDTGGGGGGERVEKVTRVLFSWYRVEIASGHGRDLISVDFVASAIPVEILGRRNRDTGWGDEWGWEEGWKKPWSSFKNGLNSSQERAGSVIIPRIVFPPCYYTRAGRAWGVGGGWTGT